MSVMPPISRFGSDEFQTPPEALKPLLPYLRPEWTIWEPACGKGYLVEGLRQTGHNVIGTDRKTGNDFLTWQPAEWDCLVTNPPFSLKNQFLEKAYALGKPFAFLLPLAALETRPRQELFRDHGVQMLLLDRRVHFEPPKKKRGNPWFASAWFCWKLNLPKQLTFGDETAATTGDKIKIKEIIIKKPVRKDLGDIQGLADSIKRYGLLHPIGVTSSSELVFGLRRLEAHKLLGLEDIEVRIIHD